MISIRASMLPRSLDCMRAAACAQFSDLVEDAGFTLNERGTGIYTAVGVGTHAAARHILTEKIKTGSLPDVGQSIEAGVAEYNNSLTEYESITYDDVTPSQGVGAYQVNVLTKAFYNDVAPRCKFPEGADPADHLELYLKTRIGDDAELSGHIDIRTASSVVDTKSGKMLRPVQTQLGAYSNLLSANGYEYPDSLIVAHLPRVHKEKIYPGTTFDNYPVKFCVNESWYLVNQIIRDVKNFKQSGNPASFPANPQSTLCSAKYCQCYGTRFCEYFK